MGDLFHFYSDVDLYIGVRDEAFDEIFAERDVIVEAVGSPLFGFIVDPMPGGSTDHIVIYEGAVKFDFMYLKESDLTPQSGQAARCSRTRAVAWEPPLPSRKGLRRLNRLQRISWT
jgi:hypothetical protein